MPERIIRGDEKLIKEVMSVISGIEGLQVIDPANKEDKKKALAEYLEDYKKRIEALKEIKPDTLTQKINAGYRNLISDAANCATGINAFDLRDDLSDEVIKEFVVNSFLRCTSIKPTVINTLPEYTAWDVDIIRPAHAQALIVKYGLEDGEMRSNTETAKKINKNPSVTSRQVGNGLTSLVINLLDPNSFDSLAQLDVSVW